MVDLSHSKQNLVRCGTVSLSLIAKICENHVSLIEIGILFDPFTTNDLCNASPAVGDGQKLPFLHAHSLVIQPSLEGLFKNFVRWRQ